MTSRVTTIAQRDQIRRFIRATRSTRHQMMNICFTIRAQISALTTTPCIPGKDDGSHAAPMRRIHIDGPHTASEQSESRYAAVERASHRVEMWTAGGAHQSAEAVLRRLISPAW